MKTRRLKAMFYLRLETSSLDGSFWQYCQRLFHSGLLHHFYWCTLIHTYTVSVYLRVGWDSTIQDFKSPCIIAPAQHSVEHQIVLFDSNFGDDTTIYQGPPTDAVDAAWEDLYNGMIPLHTSTSTVFYELTQVPDIGLSQIDKVSARRLPNKNCPYPWRWRALYSRSRCLPSIALPREYSVSSYCQTRASWTTEPHPKITLS